jgi:hypothetical protein
MGTANQIDYSTREEEQKTIVGKRKETSKSTNNPC